MINEIEKYTKVGWKINIIFTSICTITVSKGMGLTRTVFLSPKLSDLENNNFKDDINEHNILELISYCIKELS